MKIRKIHNLLSEKLQKAGLSAEIEVHSEEEVSILIEWGDWKHEHGYLRYLMEQKGFIDTNEEITDDEDSDCNSARHTIKKAT